ncbi:hypothetical protein Cgig2_008205 [Carnegiea gigantea]|uniref:Uncharacterized protein n=1 Tax=Carnegiea gigantea TaxID=171969 RepID=A0A9Q1L2R5_9CARY|nr:hypothetical protein Cgig2_008205 [Carnegiea gigantea]
MHANDDEQNRPSLPPNYVSLADLQQRWLKQQEERRREKEKEKCEPQKPNPTHQYLTGGDDDAKQQERRREKEEQESGLQQRNLGQQDLIGVEDVKKKPQFRNSKNPNLYNRRPIRRNYRDRKWPMEHQLVRNNNPEPKQSKMEGDVMVAAEVDGGEGTSNDQVDGEQKSKVERKMHKKKMHKKKKKKKKMQNPATEEQNPAKNGECGEEREIEVKEGGELKPAMEVEEKLKKLYVKGRYWKVNGKSMKPARDGECGQERETEVKGSCEARVKPAMGNQTVEVEEKFNKLSVRGRGWRSNGRSRAVTEGPNRTYRAYGAGEHRGMRKMRSENGLVWVKKGEVPENTVSWCKFGGVVDKLQKITLNDWAMNQLVSNC